MMTKEERGQREAHCQKEVESIKGGVATLRSAWTRVEHQMEKWMSAQSSVGSLLVHIQWKLHLSFSVMNNGSNAFSHQLMTTWCIGLLWNHPHYELNSSSAAQDVVRICRKNWASYEDGKDWKLYRGFQNCEESWIRRWLSIEKPHLFCLVRSRYNINCSNVFAKIDILLPPKLTYQHLSYSKLFARLRQLPCNHCFLCDIIQTWDLNIMGGFQAIQLNNCKNRVRKLVSKRRVESVKEVVIGHIVMEHPQNDEWSELPGEEQILPE